MAKKDKNSLNLRSSVYGTPTINTLELKAGANKLGEWFLLGLGAFGKIMTAPFVQLGPTSDTIYKSKKLLAKEKAIELKSEELLGKAMTWVSPLNYGAALATGNGLNARKGEEEVASWSPAWLALGRAAELYAGPKAVKGVKATPKAVVNTAAKAGIKPAKVAVVAREIKLATKNKPKYTRVPSKNLFRTQVYKGGEITDPYSNFVTTDSLYAANYGKVTPYIFESKSVAKAKEPMMGSSDPVTMDMFVYNNTKRNPNATAIIGHDAATGEFIPSKGIEILNMNPKNLYPVRISNSPTSLKFFERKPSKISEAERAGVPKGERFTPKWHVANYPGYLLKSLMKGSPLERLLSKNGTININSLMAQVNKASEVEKAVINKVLEEKFNGQKVIDYNALKKAVLEELITYSRKPLTRYNDYGIDRIGFKKDIIPSEATVGDLENMYPGRFQTVTRPLFKMIDTKTGRIVTNNAELLELVKALNDEKPYKLNTFTFESPRITIGSNKHYDATSLGHSRTFTLKDNPKKLYVLESLSDWGQSHVKMMPSVLAHQIAIEKAIKSGNTNAFHSFTNRFGSLLADKLTKYERMALENINKEIESGLPSGFLTIEDLWRKKYEILKKAGNRSDIGVLGLYLHDNYLLRQLQENLKFASENGQTTVSYATPETAAKIEGYTTKLQWYSPTGEKLDMRKLEFNPETGDFEYPKGSIMKNEYPIEHQTILKKYADFPKLFLKLFKDLKVRTVTDAKGNTWYEVNVPKGYLSREWQFKQGGKMNILEFLKNGSGIHIKEKNKGKFTSYCGGKVTDECIAKGKASSNPAIRKRATFALNARRWKHESGGILRFLEEGGKNAAPSNKFLSKGWFKLAGLTINGIANNVGDFFGTDLGKGLLDVGKGLFNGYLNYKSNSSAIESQLASGKASLEETYQNAILEAVKNKVIKLQQFREKWKEALANGTTNDNFSDIVASHFGLEEYNSAIRNAENLKAYQLAMMELQAKNAKGSLLGNMFGSIVLSGLGALGGIIGNKGTSTNTSTNTSTPTLDFFNSPSIQTKNAMAAPSYNFNTGTFNTKTIGGNLNF